MNRLDIELTYEWQPVYVREKMEYFFPDVITPFMRTKYREPAVYKWEVSQTRPDEPKIIYIGEGQEFCPQRLYGYLNPGATQMNNKRVNTDFRGYLKEKRKISISICNVTRIMIGSYEMNEKGLQEKNVRQLIVEAMIFEHRKKGFTVLLA